VQSTGNKQAEIERLYRQHGSGLLLFAISIAGERDRAQDALHQVFTKLLGSDDLQRAVDVKAYLFASVRNAVLNDLRVRQRNVELIAETSWFDPPQRDYAAEANLRRALAALPDDQREVAILHIWGELAFSQIGEVLGIPANTAASRYRYALARLREAMCAKENSCAQS
jgi:RNA polymerase sigma-70 factor, ECF subfamily